MPVVGKPGPTAILTLDELFEAWSWSQVGLQRKPSALLNVAGYYDELVEFLDRAAAAGFIKPQHRRLLAASADLGEVLDGFATGARSLAPGLSR